MSENEQGSLTVFGVTLEELMFRVPPHPDAWKGVIEAERFRLAMEKLKTDPGEDALELPALKAGIVSLAGREADAGG